nr:hypothetical protein [Tanacetum cinerariifolium]
MCRVWNMGFLSHKGGGEGRGVKAKQQGSTNDTTTNTIAVPSAGDRPVLSSSVDHTVEKVIDYGNNKGTQDGNVRQSAINSTSVTGEPSRKSVNFRALLGPAGNIADVAISLESVRAISECLQIQSMGSFCEDGLSDIATKLVAPLMLDSYTSDMCMQSWGKSHYAGAMIELRADVELKDTIVVAMPKLVGERNNVSSSGKKKQAVVASKEVGNSNPFDVLNSVEKDDDLKRQSNGKRTLMDDDGKPLPKVVSTVNVNSDSEVEDVIDDHEVFMKSTGLKRGADSEYGNNNLLEQWKTTKRDDDYDPDDDLYESHEMSENLRLFVMSWISRSVDKFSHLYALETIKDASLSERWCCFNGVWAGLWLWIINPRGRSKSDLKLLISYLQGFELRVGAEDRLLYGLYGDGGIRFVK